MGNRLEQLLENWSGNKDNLQWVLATIIETKGSAYRKAGAMMLINSLGKCTGLLSGGCLESDLMRQAQKCWLTDENYEVCYDMRDDTDIAWQLGIGCGGMVKILLQPIHKKNAYLSLDNVLNALKQRKTIYYSQSLASYPDNKIIEQQKFLELNRSLNKTNYYINELKPRPSIVIFGGGVDAIPLVNMASELGWHTSIIDSRVNYGRKSDFKKVNIIIKQDYDKLELNQENTDAIIIMHHNIKLDALALRVCNKHQVNFVGMLGPAHRTLKVYAKSGINEITQKNHLVNPIGLDLGGDLPESIALSILSQIHATLEQKTAAALGNKVEFKHVG